MEMCAIAGNDDELLNHLRLVVLPFRHRAAVSRLLRRRSLRQEPREQGPRRAPARWARRGADAKALVAIETQRELSQGEMRCRSEHSSTAGHRGVASGTARGMSEPVLKTVSCHRDSQRAACDGADDRRAATVRTSARTPAPGGGRARSRCPDSAGRLPTASGPTTASPSPPSAARPPACGAARAPRAC